MSTKYTPWINSLGALLARLPAARLLPVLLAFSPLLLCWPDLRHLPPRLESPDLEALRVPAQPEQQCRRQQAAHWPAQAAGAACQ